ncbi:MAG TPA: AAA family ATPase [Thioploca sp.]|nr:AAA family ATPase [Thioploca sp.]
MYTAHFGLNAAPFSITPDPHYLYLSVRHREALAHLIYGVNDGPGFVLLTGEVGTGKTTLCRSLIEQLPETVDVALLLNPRLTSMELLAALFDELRISYDPQFTLKEFIDTLASYLLTAHAVGRRTVLILDEAQNLSTEVLEQVRLLTNLETASQKLLQIILVGQPELNRLLKHNNLRQLAQRITARYHLLPLSLKDTQAYVNHRLAISGARSPLFTDTATRLVYRHSGGIPRLINIICDRALLGGYVKNENRIDTPIVRRAVQEVSGDSISKRTQRAWLVGLLAIALFVGGLMSWWTYLPSLPFFNHSTIDSDDSSLSPGDAELPPPSTSSIVVPPTESSSPVEETPPPASLRLVNILPKTSTDAAFVTLFGLWNLDYASLAGDKACQRAAARGLACLLRTGTWEDIYNFNRPAVIELIMTNEPKQYHLVVTHLQGDIVTVEILGETYEFSTREINEYWLGQFLLLWQPPMLPVPMLKVGITNKAVVWLRKHLDIIEGRLPSERLSPYFDSALKQRVIAFQRLQQLDPDGIVGEQTMMALQAESGRVVSQGPVLAR